MASSERFRIHVDDPPPLPFPRKLEVRARAAAASNACVLLLGERGTGKTVLAQSIHDWSPRSAQAFVRVDLASTSVELIHSELFGHTKGAFTGADGARGGLVRRADGGSAFLDEISAVPLEVQGTLLTLLQERRVRAVGSDRWQTVDVRIICATNQDLRGMAEKGRFRPDLYDRCTRTVLVVPPLRERQEELLALARRVFWTVLHHERPRNLRQAILAPDALAPLLGYSFPGNIRELESIVYASLLTAEDGLVERHHIHAALDERKRMTLGSTDVLHRPPPPTTSARYRRTAAPASERRSIVRTLALMEGNKRQAAKRLGMSRRTLYRKLSFYEIDEAEWRNPGA